MSENINELQKAIDEAKKASVSISSKYLALDELQAGTVINAFHLSYKYELEDKLDEKTGEVKPTPRHTVMFLAFEAGKFQIYISSSKVLAETIGMFDVEPTTAMQIKYLGRKGTASRKYGAWEVELLPVSLRQFEHLLPDNIKPIIRMAQSTRKQTLDSLMLAAVEEDAHVAITHQPE